MTQSVELFSSSFRSIDLGSCGTRLLKMVQPASVNGSPEPIIDTGSEKGAIVTGGWAALLVASVPVTDSAVSIRTALDAAIVETELDQFAAVHQEASMHCCMLGALDSFYEVETGNQVHAEEFEPPADEDTTLTSRRGHVTTFASKVVGFDHLPYADAVKEFLGLKPVTARVFAALSDKAQRTAFTVAGMQRQSMLKLTHRELARQVSRGADLREFRKFVNKRLISAGWTPSNPSHVETIFRTNVMKAYSAGRVEHAMKPSVLKARPFWKVIGVGDGPPRERPNHAQNNNRVLRADNPVWKEKMMPWGFMCRHRITTVKASYDGQVWEDLEGVPDKGFTAGVSNLI